MVLTGCWGQENLCQDLGCTLGEPSVWEGETREKSGSLSEWAFAPPEGVLSGEKVSSLRSTPTMLTMPARCPCRFSHCTWVLEGSEKSYSWTCFLFSFPSCMSLGVGSPGESSQASLHSPALLIFSHFKSFTTSLQILLAICKYLFML